MIANDTKSPACQACAAHVACGAKVEERRPNIIKLLDRFSDENGRSMAHAWLTRGERKQRKRVDVDETVVCAGLVSTVDQRHAPMVKRAARSRIDVRTASIENLSRLSKHMALVLELLVAGPTSDIELVQHLTERARVAPATAERTLYSIIQFLAAHGRARKVNNIVELL